MVQLITRLNLVDSFKSMDTENVTIIPVLSTNTRISRKGLRRINIVMSVKSHSMTRTNSNRASELLADSSGCGEQSFCQTPSRGATEILLWQHVKIERENKRSLCLAVP